jgi:hypothetical protein
MHFGLLLILIWFLRRSKKAEGVFGYAILEKAEMP